jgi:hypothetical protein
MYGVEKSPAAAQPLRKPHEKTADFRPPFLFSFVF